MENSIKKAQLSKVLQDLRQNECYTFDDFCNLLFQSSYGDFDEIFAISEIEVHPEAFAKIRVIDGKFVAVLMLWGADASSAIHDHSKYETRIKVLKGLLTEVTYRENQNFIEYNGAETALPNHIFPQEYSGIHSIVNNSESMSVSLHAYKTSLFDLSGVRIFDTAKRKVSWLSEKATCCSWHLPPSAYLKTKKI